MLQDFRDNLKGTAVFIVVLISVPFALVGIDQIFQGSGSTQTELSVNGEDITRLEVDRALAMHKQRLLSQYQNLDAALLDDELLRRPVQDGLVREKVVSQRALDSGMGVGKKVFSDLLKNAEAFQVDGRFDRDTYEFVLAQMGHTQSTYFTALKDSMLISQMAAGVAGTGIVTRQELELTAELIEQKRDYYYLTVPVAEMRKNIVIDEAQVEKYYRDNEEVFKTEEQVVVDYLELSVDDLMSGVEVEESLIQEQFDAELNNQVSSVRSRVGHILFANEDATINQQTIEEVQGKLAEGLSFEELAKTYSDDLGSAEQGGDLGFVDLAAFPKEFSGAVSELKVGDVSAPVETDSGIHLIRLVEKENPEPFIFSQESERIRVELARQFAEQSLPEKIEQLQESAYNAEALAEVGEEMDLELKTSRPFPRSGGADIAAFPSVVRAAYDPEVLTESHASDVIELTPGRVVVIKLREFLPVKALLLEQVRAEIVETLTARQSRQLVEQKGSEILARVRAGADVEALAKEEDLPWQVSIGTGGFGGNVDEAVRGQAFAIPARSVIPHVTGFVSDAGDYVVLSLTKVTWGGLDQANSEKMESLQTSIRTNSAQREYNAYENSLIAASDIEGLN